MSPVGLPINMVIRTMNIDESLIRKPNTEFNSYMLLYVWYLRAISFIIESNSMGMQIFP